MKVRKIIINQVAQLNASSIGKSNSLKNILYLDTSNITKNRVDNIQLLNSDITSFPSRAQRLVKKNTIIYSTVRPNLEHHGFLENPPENLIVSTGFVTIDVIDKEVDPKFLYYSLTRNHITDYLHTIATNNVSSYPSLNPDDIGNLELEIPCDINIQKKIAFFLSNLDAKINLNNRISVEFEAMIKSLYEYWFVQFDFPDKYGKPYKTSGGKMVWNKELKREIPEGWINGELENISELIRGVSYNSDDIKDKNSNATIPVLRATNITGNVIDLENMVYVPIDKVASNQILDKFDILLVMSSGSKEHIGKNGFYYFEDKVAFGAFCAKLVAKSEFRYYLYSYTQSDFIFNTIKNECLGTNINNLNNSLVNSFRIIIPPIQILKKYNQLVSAVYDKIANNYKQNQQLSSLFGWLLPMLMNGQVRFVENKKEIIYDMEAVLRMTT